MLSFVVVLFFVMGNLSAQDAGITIEEILELQNQDIQPQSAHGLISIKNISDGRVETELLLEGYGTFDKVIQLLLVFHRPTAVRNTRFLAFLSEEEGSVQWIYLPSIRRVQRVVGSNKDAPFMGTELLFSDITGRDQDDYVYTYQGTETLRGEDTWIMELTSKKEWQYGNTREWISQTSYFPIKAEFYDKKGNLVKTSETMRMEFIDGYWVPAYTEITNATTGRKTIIDIQKIEYNITIPDRYFSTAYLKQGS